MIGVAALSHPHLDVLKHVAYPATTKWCNEGESNPEHSAPRPTRPIKLCRQTIILGAAHLTRRDLLHDSASQHIPFRNAAAIFNSALPIMSSGTAVLSNGFPLMARPGKVAAAPSQRLPHGKIWRPDGSR